MIIEKERKSQNTREAVRIKQRKHLCLGWESNPGPQCMRHNEHDHIVYSFNRHTYCKDNPPKSFPNTMIRSFIVIDFYLYINVPNLF